MGIEERDYFRKHPPSCTCVDCCQKRLAQFRSQKSESDDHPSPSSHAQQSGSHSANRKSVLGCIILILFVIAFVGWGVWYFFSHQNRAGDSYLPACNTVSIVTKIVA
jgi:hypothetical protein